MDFIRRHNYAFLFVALMLILVSGAFPVTTINQVSLSDIAVWLSLLAGIGSLGGRRSLVIGGWAVVALVGSLGVVSELMRTEAMRPAMLSLVLLFFSTLAWIALRDVLFGGEVTGNRILGAVCIYLLLGLIWSCLYFYIHLYTPDAFHGVEPGVWQAQFAEITYYSFVTLTTLGYGDIVPNSPAARLLGFLEAVAGQMYVAILIAALVGRRLARHHGA